MSARIRIGVDLGGTKIEAAALDAAGNTLLRHRVPAPQHRYPATIEAVRDLVRAVEADLGEQASVGVGIPGAISPATGLVKNANSVWLNGRPLDEDLSDALAREVRLANDANCFALSEAIDGAGADYPVVFGVILGTGVGGGIVIGKNILVGRHAIAGEWGHSPLPHIEEEDAEPPACFCGMHGCIETYLSGRGLAWAYQRLNGSWIPAKDIPRRALEGDTQAIEAMDDYCDRLARALSVVTNLLDPDAIVLGGGLSNIDAIYDQVPVRLAEYVFSDVCTTPILKNRHGDSSGVRGAAWLWGR